jgi:hypothetical protein
VIFDSGAKEKKAKAKTPGVKTGTWGTRKQGKNRVKGPTLSQTESMGHPDRRAKVEARG